MSTKLAAPSSGRSGLLLLLLLLTAIPLAGCEVDSFFDQSVVGRWERTPVTLPILQRLDVIDEPAATTMDITSVQPQDLVPDVQEYVIGSGDLLTISIFELITPGQQTLVTRRVDETGKVRLPVIGAVQASDRTPSELEDAVVKKLDDQGVLRDAMVSVTLQEAARTPSASLVSPAKAARPWARMRFPSPTSVCSMPSRWPAVCRGVPRSC